VSLNELRVSATCKQDQRLSKHPSGVSVKHKATFKLQAVETMEHIVISLTLCALEQFVMDHTQCGSGSFPRWIIGWVTGSNLEWGGG
jgi:hypothetical protein